MNYPKQVLEPVKTYLIQRLKILSRAKRHIDEVDPTRDTSRLVSNAEIGDEAMEEVGMMEASALRQSVDKGVIQIRKALTRIKLGSYGQCEQCGHMIDTDRLMVMPETTLCVNCEKKKEK